MKMIKNKKIAIRVILPLLIWVVTIILLISLAPRKSQGGIESLVKYVADEGAMVNVNKSTIVQDQQGGYMTGGSVLIRGAPPKTLQPLVVQMPKFTFDACTGSADLRFGSLSFLSNAKYSEFFKSIGTSLRGIFASKLYMKTIGPVIENILSDLSSRAEFMNSLMLEQCSAAQTIADGAIGMMNAGKQQKCMMQSGLPGNERADMYDATEKCKKNPDEYHNSGEDDELKSLLGNEFNLVWKAIKRSNDDADREFKELIMSVSGTIIGRKEGDHYVFTGKPSLLMSQQLLESFMGIDQSNGEIELYECDETNKCLNPTKKGKALVHAGTFYGKTKVIIESLVKKISAKTENSENDSIVSLGLPQSAESVLTPQEENLIAFSSIPIISLIETELVSKAGQDAKIMVRAPAFIEVICYDVITNYLAEMVNVARTSVSALEQAQVDGSVIGRFEADSKAVQGFLRDSRSGAFKRLMMTLQVKESLEQQERLFEDGFNRFINQSER